jgi:hypothetical protein
MKATVRQLRARITPEQRDRVLANYRFYKVGHRDLHFLEKVDRLEKQMKDQGDKE